MLSHFKSCLTLCDPMGYSPPGSSVHGILQAGILEWVAISWDLHNPGNLPNPGIELTSLTSPGLANRFFTTGATMDQFFKKGRRRGNIKCLLDA